MVASRGEKYAIHLNFLPLLDAPKATIYRRPRLSTEEKPDPTWLGSRLPESLAGEAIWNPYWISFDECPELEPYEVNVELNRDLGRRLLLRALHDTAREHLLLPEYHIPSNPFSQEIALLIADREEGREELVIQPYYLASAKTFGLLVDFHFRLKPDVPFSRRVLQLSLVLSSSFRRNTDYYADRSAKVRSALVKQWSFFQHLQLPGSSRPIRLSKEYQNLSAQLLLPKTYSFFGGREKRSQFAGLKEFGPLQPLSKPPRLLFIFREQDRQAARRLAAALRGSRQSQYNWPGFEAVFKSPLEIDSKPVILPDLTDNSMRQALVQAQRAHEQFPNIVPVLVLPNGDDNGYLTQKAIFSHAALPTQVCTLRILEDDDSLKWAVANLGLQIFCKAGGKPWKVRAQNERSLILGISQSHKLRKISEGTLVEKYFAFSVLTDSTGLFQKLEVLGDSGDHDDYMGTLRANLKRILTEQAESFERVVIHTSFKLKYEEIDAIRLVVSDVAKNSECRFSVIKVNHRTRFFGVNRNVNSLVPYEGTQVKLGPGEYLVWFEGLAADKPNVTKAYPGPTHLQFLRLESSVDASDEGLLLQDLVNLSGANWRGFNAKSAPVSVFYCHLIADLVHDFHEHDLPMPAKDDEHPWFL